LTVETKKSARLSIRYRSKRQYDTFAVSTAIRKVKLRGQTKNHPISVVRQPSRRSGTVLSFDLQRKAIMKYMLLIYGSENSYTKEEFTQCTVDSTAISHELAAQGHFISAAPLHPVATATCVRVRDGKRLITDGPFAETTEQLGGYYLIDVPDLDDAISVAGRLPQVKKGTVEIRPVYELPAMPQVAHVPTDPVSVRR
jgi:hypothetical protein